MRITENKMNSNSSFRKTNLSVRHVSGIPEGLINTKNFNIFFRYVSLWQMTRFVYKALFRWNMSLLCKSFASAASTDVFMEWQMCRLHFMGISADFPSKNFRLLLTSTSSAYLNAYANRTSLILVRFSFTALRYRLVHVASDTFVEMESVLDVN